MREKLMTLPVSELRSLAEEQHVPKYKSMKKAELVDALTIIFEKLQKEKDQLTAPPSEDQGSRKPRINRDTNESPDRFSHRAGDPADKNQTGDSRRNGADFNRNKVKPARESVESRKPSENREAAETQENKAEIKSEAPTQEPSYSISGLDEPQLQKRKNLKDLDSGERSEGILEVLTDGYGFIRSDGYLPGDDDVYVAPSQIKKFNLRTGDYVCGNKRVKAPNEKFSALLFVTEVNGLPVSQYTRIPPFESLTPVFPHERLHLETPNGELSMRIVDLLSPIGKGQRGMIVAQPKVGKTTLLKQIARALLANHPELHIIILLIDERPEEVTDMRESIVGDNVEVVWSTFDELPEHHKKVSEMVIDRAKRLVETKRDVVILLDSITRLTRAYNLTVTPSGRTLSGGLDPAALYMPKRFFGAARCMREGGSLTILATALLDTGSRLDDVVYEEFKGTGNMELVLNRKLSERRIFPAIDIMKSSTRRDDLLLTPQEMEAAATIHRVTGGNGKPEEAAEQVLDLFASTKTNLEFEQKLKCVLF